MKKERAKIRGEEEGDLKYKDNQTAIELLQQAEEMKIDLKSKNGIQKAADDFLGLVKGKVDLPENRNAKMEVGRLIMSNKDKTSEEIMMAIFDKVSITNLSHVIGSGYFSCATCSRMVLNCLCSMDSWRSKPKKPSRLKLRFKRAAPIPLMRP